MKDDIENVKYFTPVNNIQYAVSLWLFSGMLKLAVAEPGDSPASRIIILELNNDLSLPDFCSLPHRQHEGYQVMVDSHDERVTITALHGAGLLHGVHTFLAMIDDDNKTAPGGKVRDCPRFSYRGLHLDVSRNFFGVDDVFRVMEGMTRYKLNKLHLHLTDDEGWRLEIPGIEELTTVRTFSHCLLLS